MSVPPKPWNSGAALNRVSITPLVMNGKSYSQPLLPNPTNQQQSSHSSPPVPPRPDQSSNSLLGYNRYGPGYRGYQRTMYSHLNSSLGGLGYNNQMMYGSDFFGPDRLQNSFIRFAEESSRPAFQSIESVVNGVNSISFMLESTFHAFQSSYQAVLSVADQFSRLRSHMTRMIATLAVLRNLRWLFRKILYHLGLSRSFVSEDAWDVASQAASGNVSLSNDSYPSSNFGPVFLFLGVILFGPWLLSRLFSKAIKDIQTTKTWASGKSDCMIGVATHDFRAAAASRELSFRAGQKMRIAPKNLQLQNKDWLLASVDGQNIGLVPANHIMLRHPVLTKAKRLAPEKSSTKRTKPKVQSDRPRQRTESEISSERDSINDNSFVIPEDEQNA